jgi:hypothetical protein
MRQGLKDDDGAEQRELNGGGRGEDREAAG